MNKETKELLITSAKDALLEIVVLVADKVAQSARAMKGGKEVEVTGNGIYFSEFPPEGIHFPKGMLGEDDFASKADVAGRVKFGASSYAATTANEFAGDVTASKDAQDK